MLGALLLVALQLFGEPRVFFVGLAARARAGDRMRLRHAAFHAHEHLRRRSDDRHLSHPQEVHVRRRIHVAQRAVHRERVGGDFGFESLREHDLIHIAGRDVFLRGPHHLQKPLARDVRRHLDALAGLRMRMRQIAAQLALEKLDLRARELVQRLEVVVGRDARVRDNQNPMLHVIEREHRVEDHEPGFVAKCRIRLRRPAAA